MHLIFCSDPLSPRKPDSEFLAEVETAKSLSIAYSLISFETLISEGNAERAIRYVSEQAVEAIGIYRGWMLTPEQYTHLYEVLLARRIRLINDPEAYRHTHYLPESYPVIEPFTPRSVWLPLTPDFDMDVIMELLLPFGSAPIIIKDYVKSQKYYWNEAFYIPSASDKAGVERVVRRFVELQGNDLNVGLVFREFLDFEPLGNHAKSGMPVTREYRIFFLDHEPLYSVEYWEDAEYAAELPLLEKFQKVAKAIQSRFFTMDIAKRVSGDWMIVELGDAQVAGLPARTDVTSFYSALTGRMTMQ